VDVTLFDSVAEDSTVAQLATLVTTLKPLPSIIADLGHLGLAPANPNAGACTRLKAAELIFMTPDLPETLILSQIGA
jgi:hypothetical protein